MCCVIFNSQSRRTHYVISAASVSHLISPWSHKSITQVKASVTAYRERLAARADALYSQQANDEVISDDGGLTKVTICRGDLGYPVDESKGMPLEPWEIKRQENRTK